MKVFSLWIARELCEQGFKIIEIEPNRNKPWLNVYTFEDTNEFLEAFNNVVRKGRDSDGR